MLVVCLHIKRTTAVLWIAWWLSCLPVTGDPSSPASFGEREKYALVIGIGTYDEWPHLSHAVSDARIISSLLISGGFKVTSLYDASSAETKKAFQHLIKSVEKKRAADIVIYYSGHGISQKNPSGENESYLITRDCPSYRKENLTFYEKSISSNQIKRFSDQIQSSHLIWLIDSTFSGEMFDTEEPILRLRNQKSEQPTRQMIISGSSKDAVQKKSFKKFLVRGLCGEADAIRDGYISGSELAVFLSTQIGMETKDNQHPQFASFSINKGYEGDFIFKIFPPFHQNTLHVFPKPDHASVSFVDLKLSFQQGMILKGGKYNLYVTAPGYTPKRELVEIDGNEEKSLHVELKRSEDRYINSLGMIFLSIPSGRFTMGAIGKEEKEWVDLETPSRTISFSDRYFMQSTEITVAEFETFTKDTGYQTDAEKNGGCWVKDPDSRWEKKKEYHWKNPGAWDIKSEEKKKTIPVTCISYNDADAFVQWIRKKEKKTYALPTEAQWEYACKAGTDTPFYTGVCLPTSIANYASPGAALKSSCAGAFEISRKKPIGVTSLSPNPWGLYHMLGNISEWCHDWFGPYPSMNETHPTGPDAGMERVVRGGHCLGDAVHARVFSRSAFPPGESSNVTGFRLVLNE